MRWPMELAVRAYVAALVGELDRLARRLGEDPPASPGPGRVRRRLERLARRLRRAPERVPPATVDALHRLAVLAEDRGWLETGEAIVLRKLAYRVAFYLRRTDRGGS